MPWHGAQISARAPTKGYIQTCCPYPGTVPKLVLEHQQKAIFRLVPVPGHGAQISARAPGAETSNDVTFP